MRSCAPQRAAMPWASRYSCNCRSTTSAASSRASSRSSASGAGIGGGLAAAADQGIGRRVHHFDLVGFVQERLGNAVGGALAGDALHFVLLLADVLQVDGGDDADAAVEQFLDILPALRIAAAGRIVVGQPVDQANAGMAAEDGGEVDDLVNAARVAFDDGGNHFEAGEYLLDLGGGLSLHRAHHDVLAALLAAPAFVEHAVRLADARGVSQKHFQAPAPLPALFRLDAAQQLFGIGAMVSVLGHGREAVRYQPSAFGAPSARGSDPGAKLFRRCGTLKATVL